MARRHRLSLVVLLGTLLLVVVTVLLSERSTPARAARVLVNTKTPTPTATIPPNPAHLFVTPNVAPAGANVSVQGFSYLPNEHVTVSAQFLQRDGSTVTETYIATAASDGSFTINPFPVPLNTQPGSYQISGVGQISHYSATTTLVVSSATATPTPTFTVTPTPTPRPNPAQLQVIPNVTSPGAGVTIHGTNYQPFEQVVVTVQIPQTDGSFVQVRGTGAASYIGEFYIYDYPIPANSNDGTYQVVGTGQSSGYVATAQLILIPPTPIPTNTPTLTPTPTRTPTPTITPTFTPTFTPTPTPTYTPTPTPTNTPIPKKPYVLKFKYAYLWYANVRVGTFNHVVVQANHKQQLFVLVHVVFPTGKQVNYSGKTNKLGHWEKKLSVPKNTRSRDSSQALVIVQLQHNLTTKVVDLFFGLVK